MPAVIYVEIKSRRYLIDADAIAAQLSRPHAGHAYNASLGGDIVRLPEVAIKGSARGGVQGHATPLSDHHQHHRLGAIEGGLKFAPII
jgi:hypothetical protein